MTLIENMESVKSFTEDLGFEVLGETRQRMVEPPFRGAAIGMVPGPIVIQNIDRDDWTGLGGGVESGLIGQTQVAPKPHNLNRTHACGTRITARLFLTA